MLKTLLELRHWLQLHDLHEDKHLHVTVSFSEKKTRDRAEKALVSEFTSPELPDEIFPSPILGSTTYRLMGVDVSLASSEQADTVRLKSSRARIEELERENADLRLRLDAALLELESHLTY